MNEYQPFTQILSILSPIILAVVVGYFGRKAKSDLEANAARLDAIHILVNSRLTEALAKIDELENKLFHLTGETPTGEPPRP